MTTENKLAPLLRAAADADAEIAELQAHINRLREALGVLVRTGELQMNDDRHQLYVEVSKSDIRKAKKALALTPAQSLKAHDDVLIERCAKECEYAATPYRDTDKFYICAEAVRALKGKST